jgi:hypothetical protein
MDLFNNRISMRFFIFEYRKKNRVGTERKNKQKEDRSYCCSSADGNELIPIHIIQYSIDDPCEILFDISRLLKVDSVTQNPAEKRKHRGFSYYLNGFQKKDY